MTGFTIADTLILPSGISIANSYAYIDTCPLHLKKNEDDTYTMTGNCKIWKDQASYTQGKTAIKCVQFISSSITYSQLSSANPYAVAYQELKSQFTTTMDV